jgi:uncharacterized protein YjfI (DUF2170 family)
MTKFVLILALCSNVHSACMSPVQDAKAYDTFRECILQAYDQSLKILTSIDIKEVDGKELYTKFICKDKEDDTL